MDFRSKLEASLSELQKAVLEQISKQTEKNSKPAAKKETLFDDEFKNLKSDDLYNNMVSLSGSAPTASDATNIKLDISGNPLTGFDGDIYYEKGLPYTGTLFGNIYVDGVRKGTAPVVPEPSSEPGTDVTTQPKIGEIGYVAKLLKLNNLNEADFNVTKDANGNVTQLVANKAGAFSYIIKYEDNNEVKITRYIKNNDSAVRTTSIFDKNGILRQTVEVNNATKDSVTTNFDASGNKTSKVEFFNNPKDDVAKIETKYDASGNVTSIVKYDEDDNIITTETPDPIPVPDPVPTQGQYGSKEYVASLFAKIPEMGNFQLNLNDYDVITDANGKVVELKLKEGKEVLALLDGKFTNESIKISYSAGAVAEMQLSKNTALRSASGDLTYGFEEGELSEKTEIEENLTRYTSYNNGKIASCTITYTEAQDGVKKVRTVYNSDNERTVTKLNTKNEEISSVKEIYKDGKLKYSIEDMNKKTLPSYENGKIKFSSTVSVSLPESEATVEVKITKDGFVSILDNKTGQIKGYDKNGKEVGSKEYLINALGLKADNIEGVDTDANGRVTYFIDKGDKDKAYQGDLIEYKIEYGNNNSWTVTVEKNGKVQEKKTFNLSAEVIGYEKTTSAGIETYQMTGNGTGVYTGKAANGNTIKYTITDNYPGDSNPRVSADNTTASSARIIFADNVWAEIKDGQQATINADGTVTVKDKNGNLVFEFDKNGFQKVNNKRVRASEVGSGIYIQRFLQQDLDLETAAANVRYDASGRISSFVEKGVTYNVTYEGSAGAERISAITQTKADKSTFKTEYDSNGKVSKTTETYAKEQGGVKSIETTYNADGTTTVVRKDKNGAIIPEPPVLPATETGSKEKTTALLKSISGLSGFNLDNYNVTVDVTTGKVIKLTLKSGKTATEFNNKLCSTEEINISYSDGKVIVTPKSKDDNVAVQFAFKDDKISTVTTTYSGDKVENNIAKKVVTYKDDGTIKSTEYLDANNKPVKLPITLPQNYGKKAYLANILGIDAANIEGVRTDADGKVTYFVDKTTYTSGLVSYKIEYNDEDGSYKVAINKGNTLQEERTIDVNGKDIGYKKTVSDGSISYSSEAQGKGVYIGISENNQQMYKIIDNYTAGTMPKVQVDSTTANQAKIVFSNDVFVIISSENVAEIKEDGSVVVKDKNGNVIQEFTKEGIQTVNNQRTADEVGSDIYIQSFLKRDLDLESAAANVRYDTSGRISSFVENGTTYNITYTGTGNAERISKIKETYATAQNGVTSIETTYNADGTTTVKKVNADGTTTTVQLDAQGNDLAAQTGTKQNVAAMLKTVSGLTKFNINDYDITTNSAGKVTKLKLKSGKQEIKFNSDKCSTKEINISYNSDGTVTFKPATTTTGVSTEIVFKDNKKKSLTVTYTGDAIKDKLSKTITTFDANGKKATVKNEKTDKSYTTYTYTNGVKSSAQAVAADKTKTDYTYYTEGDSKGKIKTKTTADGLTTTYTYTYDTNKKLKTKEVSYSKVTDGIKKIVTTYKSDGTTIDNIKRYNGDNKLVGSKIIAADGSYYESTSNKSDHRIYISYKADGTTKNYQVNDYYNLSERDLTKAVTTYPCVKNAGKTTAEVWISSDKKHVLKDGQTAIISSTGNVRIMNKDGSTVYGVWDKNGNALGTIDYVKNALKTSEIITDTSKITNIKYETTATKIGSESVKRVTQFKYDGNTYKVSYSAAGVITLQKLNSDNKVAETWKYHPFGSMSEHIVKLSDGGEWGWTTSDRDGANKPAVYTSYSKDKNGNTIYSVTDNLKGGTKPTVTTRNKDHAIITFANGKTVEVTSGQIVTINADKTVEVKNKSTGKIIAKYNANGVNTYVETV